MTETKSCFVICPIGADGSDERLWSDDISKNLIEPMAQEFGYSSRRSNDKPEPGEIKARVVKDVINADLVESRSRKSGQDDKWSFCLTAGTL